MQFFRKISLKSLKTVGAATLLSCVCATSWAGYAYCQGPCTTYAQQAYTSSKAYYTTQQTNYCNSLTDPSAKSACLAGVPSYAEQQAQATYTSVYNQCMLNCNATP